MIEPDQEECIFNIIFTFFRYILYIRILYVFCMTLHFGVKNRKIFLYLLISVNFTWQLSRSRLILLLARLVLYTWTRFWAVLSTDYPPFWFFENYLNSFFVVFFYLGWKKMHLINILVFILNIFGPVANGFMCTFMNCKRCNHLSNKGHSFRKGLYRIVHESFITTVVLYLYRFNY